MLAAEAGCKRGTRNSTLTAIASLVQFDTLARPTETWQVCGDCALKTTTADGEVAAALTFYPSSQAREDKNKQQDDAIVVGEVVDAP